MQRRWLALSALLVVALAIVSLPQHPTKAAAPAVVGLVVVFADGGVHRECVPYRQNMTGYDVLAASTFSATLVVEQSASVGAAICKIGDTGCMLQEGCFCQCRGVSCTFWNYSVLANDAWRVSNLGATNSQVQPGGVEGWAWGDNAALPPPTSFNDVCGVGAQHWLPVIIGDDDS